MPTGSATWCALTGNEHLEGFSLDVLALSRLFDLTAAVWTDKKKRPESLTPSAPAKRSADAPAPDSVAALKAFLQ